MNNAGYFTVHRKIADNGLFRDNHSARHLFVDLLRMAAFRETVMDWRGKPITVGRGQLMISLPRLADATGFSVRNVRTLLAQMANHGIVKTDTPADTAPTRITICKYDEFQGQHEKTDTPADTLPTRKRTKEIIKEENKDITHSSSSYSGSDKNEDSSLSSKSNDFDRFWAAYPRRDGKAVAERAFLKALKRKGVTADQLIDAATRRVSIPTTERRFIPMASTWLNQERYLDAKDTTPEPKPAPPPPDRMVEMYQPLWGGPSRPYQESPDEDLEDLARRQAEWDATWGAKKAAAKAAEEAKFQAARDRLDQAYREKLIREKAERDAAREAAEKAAAEPEDDNSAFWEGLIEDAAPARPAGRTPDQAQVHGAGKTPHAMPGVLVGQKASQPTQAGPRGLDRQPGLPGVLHPLPMGRDGVVR